MSSRNQVQAVPFAICLFSNKKHGNPNFGEATLIIHTIQTVHFVHQDKHRDIEWIPMSIARQQPGPEASCVKVEIGESAFFSFFFKEKWIFHKQITEWDS